MLLTLSIRYRKTVARVLFWTLYTQVILSGYGSAIGAVPYGVSRLPYRSSLWNSIPVDGGSHENKHQHPSAAHATRPAIRVFPEHPWQPGAPAPEVAPAKVQSGGPTQPEMQTFQSVNANNMVDLFTGDFSYNIPLMDVGGYPVNISYHSGRLMDEDASWVGLGWNINPGAITREVRGIPDDFDGGGDTVRKVAHIKQNFTWGVNASANLELIGLPITLDSTNVNLGLSLGVFHNTYQGWGAETSLNASINAGEKSGGLFSGGLGLSDNSQNGLTINPSLSTRLFTNWKSDDGGFAMGAQMGFAYNARTGIRALQLGLNDHAAILNNGNLVHGYDGNMSTAINFAAPTYTPTINLSLTNYNVSLTVKLGLAFYGTHPNLYVEGYVGNEYVAAPDTALSLPAYGYMNFQDIRGNWTALTDFNREKEIPYRENPPIPHIAVPAYTYDIFSISGEGTGGMFRAYRGDIGFISDPQQQTKTLSGALSLDLGSGELLHGGTDLNANYSTTKTGPWIAENTLLSSIAFQPSNGLYEATYFRNPGEKTIDDTNFYKAIGGDDVVTPVLYQSGNNSGPSIIATNVLTRSSGQEITGYDTLTAATAVRNVRDKRSEVITYLNASEASQVGLDKYIYHYGINQFGLQNCAVDTPVIDLGLGTGVSGNYFMVNNMDLAGVPITRQDPRIYFNWNTGSPFWCNDAWTVNYTNESYPGKHYSALWTGRLKAPSNGQYTIATLSDDGVRLWINDSLVISNWTNHPVTWDSVHLNLVAGVLYDIKMEYYQDEGVAVAYLAWEPPGFTHPLSAVNNLDSLPMRYLYPPITTDTAQVNPILVQENRVNSFRKANHISEIDVLNPDGRRYVYGIPVYNLYQKEASFSVTATRGNQTTGLTGYQNGFDNTAQDTSGKDGYFSSEQLPAYAHAFLLTGILSPDYVDVTGDGITDDDLGDAVKFNYTKVAGIANPYGWRAPYVTDSATYDEGFRSYIRDDKGQYIYGTKELWYLNSIVSKTMIATFTLQKRSDLLGVDELGDKYDSTQAMCLKEIDLYSKADFIANGTNATPIKTVHFVYDYELCRGINEPVNDSGKLTLKEIWFSYNGNNKGILNPYVFNYHPNNPNYKVNASDKWGTYKDASMNPGASPTKIITNAEYPYAIQDSTQAAYNAGAWMLDSIILPSGGSIKVNYESDDYAYVQNRRATRMLKIAGFGSDTSGAYINNLYDGNSDNFYAYINVPYEPVNDQDLYNRYLDGLTQIYFRMYLQMPSDEWGSGYDYVPAYAAPDTTLPHWYGIVSTGSGPPMIWIKIMGVDKTGDGPGTYSPVTETAINFLRLNLPDKAYPGSEVNDNLDIRTAITVIQAMAGNVLETLRGFDGTARGNGWVNQFDTSRSYVRLDCPTFKKIGGGLRVKSILIYDNWNNMTQQRQTVYGQTYHYTMTQSVGGTPVTISSGVASWEPVVGAEENPFHLPIDYVNQSSMLAPAATLYTEEPLGETFYPAASVGYRQVRVQSIHNGPNIRSSNGFSESTFYTTYDFPTLWDWSVLDNTTEKRYKPILNNLLRIDAKNYLTMSQGFKVELNDMNGKPHTEADYAQTDSVNPIKYTEYDYQVDNPSVQTKHLNNTVMTIDPWGNIDTAATIGKDAELMTDLREETTTAIGGNINLNADMFTVGPFPVILPSLWNLFQEEVDQFRSVAMSKVIQRYGIIDSVIHIDRGSKVTSRNLLYDAETGDPILVRTQNEFNDPIYEFTYPSHWAYDGVGPAYQNVDAILYHLTVTDGKITAGLPLPDTNYLTTGDELIAYSKQTITPSCTPSSTVYASFPNVYKLWVVDTALMDGGTPSLYLMDQYGTPFSGNDVTIKVTRSGHRNIEGSVGSVTSLNNPIVSNGSGGYQLVFDSTTGVVNASANVLQQVWQVEDSRRSNIQTSCVATSADSAEAAGEGCSCLQPFFGYLMANQKLVVSRASQTTVRQLVVAAIHAGAAIDTNSCPILQSNMNGIFYSTPDSVTPFYEAVMGSDIIDLISLSGFPEHLSRLVAGTCDGEGRVLYKDPTETAPPVDTVSLTMYPGFSANFMSTLDGCPFYLDTLLNIDSLSDDLLIENNLPVGGAPRNSVAVLRFDQLNQIPYGSTILSAKLILQADTAGHLPGVYDSANSINPVDSESVSITAAPGWFPYLDLDTLLYQAYNTPWYAEVKNASPFQNDTINITSYVNGYLNLNWLSSTFVLTQGSKQLLSALPAGDTASTIPVNGGVPPYLLSGYGGYYSTFYNERNPDTAKWPVIQIAYVTPQGFTDTSGVALVFNSTISCNTVIGRTCYSSVTDTLVNPYQFGILGNFRPLANYVYYNSRSQSDPTQPTNIRKDGTIAGFMPFWSLQGSTWAPSTDSSRWVWNTQTTLYNRKGFEIENKDPLGRHNAGLYGYGETLPTAVVQNAQFQESAFEGFEDYGFPLNSCNTTCPITRPFDFTPYQAYISDSMAHTGLYSLRIPTGDTVSLTVPVAASPNLENPSFTDTTGTDNCGNGEFYGFKASSNSVLPPFEPYQGKLMLVSAWVKEADSCYCKSYTNDEIVLSFSTGTGTVVLHPSGNLIEGWQRYEATITIPSTATTMTLSLIASDSAVTYFDDIRIHPFNAEMKSYVYNPVNLRLMAELDDNNYATFYEYDDDGTLVRVKKETERGILTLKETRTALMKNN